MSGYAPPGRVLWDPWFVTDHARSRYLMYHLSAPQGLTKLERDDQAEIWVAESSDLESWECCGPALVAGPEGTDFDLAIWSGATTQCDDEPWLTFFTGRSRRGGKRQSVCVATSVDGLLWDPLPEPLLPPPQDHPIYDTALDGPVFPAWRDPFHVRLPSGEHMLLVTAQHRDSPVHMPGCLATATARDPRGPYALSEPLLAGGHYAQIELPQLIHRFERWWLFFSTAEKDYPPGAPGQTGLHCWVSNAPRADYQPLEGRHPGVVPGGGTESGLYGTKLVGTLDGNTVAIGWYWNPACFEPGADENPKTLGATPLTLSPPLPVRWTPQGVEIIG